MRFIYPDWKYEVSRYLGMPLPSEWNELIWTLYDAGYAPKETADYLVKRMFPGHVALRVGLLGTMRALMPKERRK